MIVTSKENTDVCLIFVQLENDGLNVRADYSSPWTSDLLGLAPQKESRDSGCDDSGRCI